MKRMTAAAWLILAGAAGPLLVPAAAVAASPEVKDVSVERQAEGLTVRIRTTGPAAYETSLIDSPTRLIIDFKDTRFAWAQKKATPEAAPIREIRGSQWKPGIARVVLELQRKVGYRIEEGPAGLSVVLEPRATVAAKGEAPAAAQGPKGPAAPAPKAAEPVKKAEAPKGAGAPAPAPSARDGEAVTKAEAVTPVPARPAVQAKPDPAPAAKPPAPVASAPTASPTPGAAPRPAAVALVPAAPAPAAPPIAQVTAVPPRLAQAQATTPAPGAQQPVQNGRLLSMDFKDAEVVNLLRILAAESGRNIVAGPDVRGKISVSLRSVTWEQALETVLEVAGLSKIEKAGVIRIVSLDQLTKEREAQARVEEAKRRAEIETRTKLVEAQLKEQELATKRLIAEADAEERRARGPLREETIRLSYADPDEVARTLQGILGIPPEGTAPVPTAPLVPAVLPSGPGAPPAAAPGQPYIAEPPFSQMFGPQAGQARAPLVSVSQDVLAKGITIRAHKPTNTIFIRHYAADLERIKKLVREQLDVPLPQVKIEGRMEILDRNALEAIGIQWGGAYATNVGHSTLVGQGFQSAPGSVPGQTLPIQGGVLQSDGSTIVVAPTPIRPGMNPSNPALTLSQLLPVDLRTGLPLGSGNLVNLPIQALPNVAQAGGPTAGIAFGIVGTNWNINLALQALETQGKSRTLARPEIVTVENNKAVMSLGEEIPFATVSSAGTQVQFKEAVLKLEVTPTVVRERVGDQEIRKIKMIVVVENNSRGVAVPVGTGATAPVINRRKAETQVLVREGERLVIGGVTQTQQDSNVRKVPILGDIPVLGWLFKEKENFETGREMVVFVTPSILTPDPSRSAQATPGR